MDYTALIASIVVGLITSGIVAFVFYRVGRTDTESLYRRVILTSIVMRLKEMTPTSQERIPNGYGLGDTAHWLTCLKEVLAEIGFREDAACIEAVVVEMKQAPHIQIPNEQQRKEGEAKKKTWEAKFHKRIEQLK